MKNMKKIAVVGAGIMGTDVAFDAASHGNKVILVDIKNNILDKAQEKIKTDYRLYKMMNPKMDSTLEQILDNIEFSTDYSKLKDLDIIIENVPEDVGIKNEVYKNIKSFCTEKVKVFINTSCISITQLASNLKYSENVIGVHFMNPVPMKDTVEVIKGHHTSKDTIEFCESFLKSLNKSAVIVNDYPGFVANRLSHLFMNEAAFLVQDQVALPKDIDQIFKKGYGHKSGPLETADLIGLDTVVNSLEILYESYQDSKFRCCPLLKKMVNAGELGRKSGKGFYKYK